MTSQSKINMTDDVFNKLLKIVLNVDNIEQAYNIKFNIDTLRLNNTLTKYLESHMGDELRKCLYFNQCRTLNKQIESTLNESNIITIFRAVLRYKQHKLTSMHDKLSTNDRRVFYIPKSKI